MRVVFFISFCIYIEVFQFGLMGLVANIHLYVCTVWYSFVVFIFFLVIVLSFVFRLLPSVSVE